MKKIFFRIVVLLLIFSNTQFIQAQTKSKTWTKNPFDQKVFIENKSQFDGKDNLPNSTILYGVRNEGIQIYFTPKGLTYRHDEFVEMTEAEKEKAEKSGSKMEPEMMRKKKTDCVSMEWKNANPEVQVIAEDVVSNYFTYGDLRDKSGKTSIKALAYKKIIYKNLYPNIDVEYSFPENKTGIKYSIILHPGADASLVKMMYSENGKINVDESGNVKISSSFGNIIDHAPIAQYEAGQNIISKFNITNNSISFQLANYDRSKAVIIDPWITVPTYIGSSNAYDVDADLAGNVYIYGGTYNADNYYQESKLNSSGTILWTYTANVLVDGEFNGAFYGDFAVDGHSQSSYLCEGFNGSGARVVKINSSGMQIDLSPQNSLVSEMWRIVYNIHNHSCIVAGGGVNNPTYQSSILDTNLATNSPINVLATGNGGGHDVAILAQDKMNSCYMAPAQTHADPNNYNNVLIKVLIPALAPTTYVISDGYSFKELSSVFYLGTFEGEAGYSNGFNGMAANSIFLYTYNSSILKKWNAATGILLDTVKVATAKTDSTAWWGGLQVDDCDRIFAGAGDSIKQYDVNLNLVATIPATDTVYDLKLGINNLLYACGKGFVQSIPLVTVCDSNPIEPPNPPQTSTLIIPNVFSPNGDGKNDVFKVQSSGISTFDAQIFDRWGIKLYEWNNVNDGWDGKIKSSDDAPDGTYYYLINATGVDGKKYNEKGFLTLLR